MQQAEFHLHLRTQELTEDSRGYTHWRTQITEQPTNAAQTAIIICDMWDKHWSRGASERVDQMVGRMNDVVTAARRRGAYIIHAPSDTMDFYAEHPARLRALAAPHVEPPPAREHTDPRLPIDDSDEGSDTGEIEPYRAWRRQHATLEIDPTRDFISDNGREVYNILRQQGIQQVLIMGVATNMCMLNRSFAIKQMVKWAMPIALVRDLTDTMYNPARAPYVSHDEGTRLVVGYIEKFWCPSILSEELIGA